MTTDLSIFFNTDEFATAITYAGSSVNAIVDYDENLNENLGSALAEATLLVKVGDVASPAYRDAVIIDSVTWVTREIISGDKDVWKLKIQRDERPII